MDPTALGRYLRESRETREITLDDAVSALRIRRNVLERFEAGEFDVAETEVQVRGLLRNYARYLQLNEGTVLSYYEAARQDNGKKSGLFGRRKEANDVVPRAPRKITDTPPALPIVEVNAARDARRRTFLTTLVQGLVGLAALLVVVYISVQLLNLQPVDATPEAPTEVAAVAGPPTETYTPTWTPMPAVEDSQIVDTTTNNDFFASGVSIEIELLQRSWMRVIADGVEQFSGIATAGETFRSEASQQIELSVANAAAVMINFNGRELEPLGVRGQQVNVVFSPSGVDMEQANEGLQPTSAVTQASTQPTLPAEVEESQTPIGSGGVQSNAPTPTPLFSDSSAISPTSTVDAASSAQNNAPSPTPLFSSQATATPGTDVDNGADNTGSDEVGPQPTDVLVDTATPTLTPTLAPSATVVPTQTVEPTATAILPPRVTPSNLPTQKP